MGSHPRATVALAVFACLWGCDPFNTGFADLEPADRYQAAALTEAPESPESLRVMNWNIKFGGGRIDFFFDCHGDPGRSLMSEDEVLSHLEGLAAKINEVNPDLLMIQEADVLSKRSAYVDMVQWLLDHTELNHGVYASQWKADFVASDGIGRVESGSAILSRYPFGDATRIALPLVVEYDALKNHFYLKRNVLKAELLVPGQDNLWALTTHSEAYSQDGTKKKHIDRFKEELDAIDDAGGRFVGGGDLNAIPPGSEKTKDFADSVCVDEEFQADDYSEELDWLDGLYERYQPAVSLEAYADNNACHFTHTTTDKSDGNFWSRKLDYLFTNTTFSPGSTVTHQGDHPDEASSAACEASTQGLPTMPLSDHAPVVTTWEVSP
ncbi:MAG: endonuclease/exonuclease/phosphatase family protein [Myxococcota bacterium]|nr:endonuclease/exonuclease/phosphatase family protein [Myxococcota bacterium]